MTIPATEDEIIQTILPGKKATVIKFYTDSCSPCKMMEPIVDRLAHDYQGTVEFYKVNAEQCGSLLGEYDITKVPAFLFLNEEGETTVHMGAIPPSVFRTKIANYCNVY
jgi:thioredoxin 1